MVEYSEEEQKLARLLLDGPKSVEELRQKMGITANEINEALKKLIKLRLVERNEDGNYRLIRMIEKQLKGFEGEVEENFKAKFTIEALSQSKEAVDKQLEMLETKLKTEKIKINKLERAETQQNEDNYTSYIDVEFYTESFNDLISMIVSYGPSSVELISPKNTNLSLREGQDCLNNVMSAVHYYISMILSLKHKELIEKAKKPVTEEQK